MSKKEIIKAIADKRDSTQQDAKKMIEDTLAVAALSESMRSSAEPRKTAVPPNIRWALANSAPNDSAGQLIMYYC